MTGPRRQVLSVVSTRDGESGATLVLAMIFLIAFALIIGALANWTSTGLSSTLQFQNAASKYYAAEGVTQVAIRQLRYSYPAPAGGSSFACPLNVPAGPSPPPTSSAAVSMNDVLIQDWCSIKESGETFRIATVTACLVTSGTVLNGPCTVSSGSATKLLAAQVTFTDYSPTSYPTSPTCTSSTLSNCGESMSFNYWTAS